jgi:hypothetical protein
MAALESRHRMMIKKNKSKLLSLKYSPEIYKVYKVIKPDDFVKERYLIRDSNNVTVLTELKLNNPNAIRQAKLFFGSELLRVGDNAENITDDNFLNNDNDLINAVEDDNNDEEEEQPKPIEPLRRSPRIPIPNKRYEDEDQEPEQEIIKPIPTKTKKPKPTEPIEPVEPLRRSTRTPVPNKRYI